MLQNTKTTYGSVAKFLHWAVALGFLGAYCAVYYRHWFTEYRTAENLTALHVHLSFGISVFILVLLRIIWRLNTTIPNSLSKDKKEIIMAKMMHSILYFFMIAMPITGYFGTKLDTEFFYLFTISKFPDTYLYGVMVENWLGLDWKSFEAPVDFFHKNSGAYIVWILILLHAMAGFYHHYYKKDKILIRMLPNIRK